MEQQGEGRMKREAEKSAIETKSKKMRRGTRKAGEDMSDNSEAK